MLRAGTELKGYRIERLLGRGGMGEVYEATQLRLSRRVAFKVVYTARPDGDDFVERFQREGRLQAALDHPHVVTVYEAGELDDGLFLAMRLVEGSTLKDLVRGDGMEPERAIRLLRPVADALDTAHSLGVVHRDVKPQNILVGAGDYPYLADFGLVRRDADTGLTHSGHFVGTIHYAAPEQIQGETSGPPADVYALAAVLYECLTGSVPFPRDAQAAVIYAQLADPPPKVSARRPDLPSALDDLIAAGMAKRPDERPPSAGELIERAGSLLVAAPATVNAGPAPAPATVRARPAPAASPARPAARTTVAAPEPATVAAGAPGAAAESISTASTLGGPRRRRLGVPALAGAALALIAAGAFIAGRAGHGDEGAAPLSVSASNNALAVRAPASWERVSSAAIPAIAGMRLSDPVGLADTSRPASGMSAGTTRATGSTLLPSTLRAQLTGGLPDPERMRMGELAALRYRNVAVRGFDRSLTIYAAPTSAGVVTALCYAPVGQVRAFEADCERVVGTTELLRGAPRALGGTPELARAAKGIVSRLNRELRRDTARLSRARTAAGQAGAADALAHDYDAAARRIDALATGPALDDVRSAVTHAMRSTAQDYSGLAAAARAPDPARYSRVRSSMASAQARVRTRLAAFAHRLARA